MGGFLKPPAPPPPPPMPKPVFNEKQIGIDAEQSRKAARDRARRGMGSTINTSARGVLSSRSAPSSQKSGQSHVAKRKKLLGE